MEFDRLRELYNRCNPDEALEPNDPRTVDIDGRDVRGTNWTAPAWDALVEETGREAHTLEISTTTS